ncbi:antirestriction protein ArdA [Myroides odoratimimus]|uniref:antirestriction protein ArdA n=1 Tax=Myroides odoratimimus TaxID=76832 RepID=UPI0021CEE3E3|nr:antirestriction protein ArdA [Myroides odoratimimus]WHT75169.1 antirestriction protein ArdA [Myroides odoratimimus]WHU39754.1 antirestriction protein ArdA [Myroides odoratimimus]
MHSKVYVGTYAKYNNGSIKGDWIELNNFSSIEEFYEFCSELHSDETDPEFMFQDSDYPFMHLLYSQLLVCQRVCLQNTVCLICK